ncbi:MAG TPA: hypothetical protein VK932_20035 [Kofleriaceae bacterium]|nr:hypothetical protein [Kofleriaceae bacterium]
MSVRAAVRPARLNPFAALLSLLVLLLGGTALADRIPERQRRVPQARVEPAPPAPVRHDTRFQAVPDAKLEMRAIQYDGSTNGRLHVQVRNPGKTAQKFSAKGLYFVPEGDPDSAPQRLGAVGPMQIAGDGKEVGELEVAPGATVDVVLDVFCIDSHRASPSPQNKFSIGVKKMPKELVQTIENRADAAVDAARVRGNAAPRPAAKSSIQGEVWRSRDSRWVELDGEGKQEVGKKK